MTLASLASYLAPIPLGGLRLFEQIGSTNDEALAWAQTGAPDCALVVADQQTAGRGRLQRKWVTNPGSALAFSLIIRPDPVEMEALAMFSPWGALSVCLALEKLGLQPQIKWPNDVLLTRRKVAGLLVESDWHGANLQALVIGIGLNVSPPAVPPADQVMYPAGCVEAELGGPVDRWALLTDILTELLAWRPRLGSPAFFAEWERRLAFRGEWVRVGDGLGSSRVGQVQGLAPDGSLLLCAADGQSFTLQAGEISLRLANEDTPLER